MNLQRLLQIDEDLEKGEVAQLKFLCTDLVQKKRLETVTDFKDLFQRLEEQGLDEGLLIPELLITIRRLDLLKILNTSKEQVEHDLAHDDYTRVSSYRKMLFQLSEDMTEENLRNVKFLVDLPKAKRETCTSFLDIIIEMEKQQKLGEDNLDELKDILDKCDKQLADRIEKFRNTQRDREQGGRPPLQELSNQEHFIPSYPERSITNSMGTDMTRRPSFGLATDSQIEEQTTTNDKDYYSISHTPVGHCLIINNYNFEMSETSEGLTLRNRKGTDTDKESLERVFKRMCFEITVHDDLTASEMLKLVKTFSEKDHSQMDIFVCCVLSHGEKGAVYGVDGKHVEIRDLTQPFAKCRTLANKPKLFFIQACQGKAGQEAMWTADGQEQNTEEGTYEEDAQKVASYSIPIEADLLIGMATVEYYQSYRHTTDGSIYIQELCRQLEDLCPKKEDILSILTKVNSEVSTKTLRGYKQMPEPRYTLRKKLVLPMD